jgi:hypothetical protein
VEVKMNPLCPEPNCKLILRLKKLKTNAGLSSCPKCRSDERKKYILTESKKGMFKCMKCRTDYMPKRKEGLSRFFICKDHPWQKFKVGAEVIMPKTRPLTEREVEKQLGELKYDSGFASKPKPRPRRM